MLHILWYTNKLSATNKNPSGDINNDPNEVQTSNESQDSLKGI